MEILNKDQAWRDFAQNVKPGIWESLTYAERDAIQQAEKDFRNERTDIRGKPVNLGMDRVKRILEQYAPERYEIQIRFECRVK